MKQEARLILRQIPDIEKTTPKQMILHVLSEGGKLTPNAISKRIESLYHVTITPSTIRGRLRELLMDKSVKKFVLSPIHTKWSIKK